MFYQVRYVAYTILTRGISIRQTLFSELRGCSVLRNIQHVQPGRLRLHVYRGLSPISDNLQTCLQDTGKLVQCFGSNIEVRVGVCKRIFLFVPLSQGFGFSQSRVLCSSSHYLLLAYFYCCFIYYCVVLLYCTVLLYY